MRPDKHEIDRLLILLLMVGAALVYLLFFAPRVDAGPFAWKRKDVAAEAFEFLRKHAKPYPEDPMQWECWEAYDLHRAAKELWGAKPLPKIKMPESGWDKGCYVPYSLPTQLLHEALYFKIDYLIQIGEGEPTTQRSGT